MGTQDTQRVRRLRARRHQPLDMLSGRQIVSNANAQDLHAVAVCYSRQCSITSPPPPKSSPAGKICPGEMRPGADFYTQMFPPAISYTIKVLPRRMYNTPL